MRVCTVAPGQQKTFRSLNSLSWCLTLLSCCRTPNEFFSERELFYEPGRCYLPFVHHALAHNQSLLSYAFCRRSYDYLFPLNQWVPLACSGSHRLLPFSALRYWREVNVLLAVGMCGVSGESGSVRHVCRTLWELYVM